MLKVAVVGVGGWGKNHVRVFKLLSAEGLVDELYAVDIDEGRLRWAEKVYGARPLRSIDEAVKADVDAAVIATPTKMHRDHASVLLSAGVSLLVEKPFTESYLQAVELLDKARGVVVTTGYVLRFHPAVKYLRDRLGDLGRVVSVYGRRTSPKPQRPGDVGVIKDLTIHDFDLALYAIGNRASSVSAYGLVEDGQVVHAQIFARGDKFSSFYESSWTPSYKFRRFEVVGTEGTAVIDFSTDALTFFGREGVWSPRLSGEEPLLVQDREFLKAVAGRGGYVVPAEDIIYTLKLCDAAEVSIKRGREVYLDELEDLI
ncbi:MAG: Gfo/Idh/MocA family protein [Thermoproteus sp.]|jgi:UDP-N-acetylglucosamine 3-dehydrogenase